MIAHREETSLLQAFKWSILSHIGVFLLFLIKIFLLDDPIKPYVPSLRVDLVALPDVLKKDQAAPMAASPKKTEQKSESKESHEPTFSTKKHPVSIAEKNREALQRLKTLTKLQEWKEEANSRSSIKPIKGNQLSQGSSVDGEARESAATDYRDLLKDRLSPNFQLPVWLKRQPLSAQVYLFIAESGKVIRYSFKNASGNPQFDSLVIRAIEQSEPLPTPPQELRQRMMKHGILVGFPL